MQNCHSSFCILAKEDKRSSVCSDCHISRCGVGFYLALSVGLRANGLQGLLNERIGTENELVQSRRAPPKGIFSSKHNGLGSVRSVCPCVHGVQESISRESGIFPGKYRRSVRLQSHEFAAERQSHSGSIPCANAGETKIVNE